MMGDDESANVNASPHTRHDKFLLKDEIGAVQTPWIFEPFYPPRSTKISLCRRVQLIGNFVAGLSSF